jgi:RND family efflux transporter MFP subunit
MRRPSVFNLALPVAAAGLFSFALFSVLSHPVRTQAAPELSPPSAPFAATVAGVGVVEPRSEAIAIGANLPGVVAAVRVNSGDHVRAGEKLFEIDDRSPRAELELAETHTRSAEVALADARDQSSRAAQSYARQATSDSDATRKRFAVALAETHLAEARAETHRIATEIDRLTVTAPIDARVWRVNVRAGEYAAAGPLAQPLMILGDDAVLHVRVEIDQTDAHRVKPEAPAVASLRGDGGRQAKLAFVRFEPLVQPKRALSGDGTERVDTRVLEVIYALPQGAPTAFVGQQMDVFIEAEPLGIEEVAPDALR